MAAEMQMIAMKKDAYDNKIFNKLKTVTFNCRTLHSFRFFLCEYLLGEQLLKSRITDSKPISASISVWQTVNVCY